MRVVAVGGIVQIDKLRPRHREDAQDVGAHVGLARVLQVVAGIAELHHDAVFADERGLALLLLAHVLHLLVGVFLIGPLRGLPAPLVTTTPPNHLLSLRKQSAIP